MKRLIFIFFLGLLFNVGSVTAVYAQEKMELLGSVSDQFGGLPGAYIVVEGTSISTITDIKGNYKLNLDKGAYIITASYTLYTPATKKVTLKETKEIVSVDFVLETGFVIDQDVSINSKTVSSNLFNASSPIEVVTAQDLANSFQTDLSQVLQYIVPSFHSARQTQSGLTDHVDPAALRGLGPDQILVLINGKRRHNSAVLHIDGTVGRGTAGVDFNAIPVSAIDRIEILRDGGTAEYGYDALAGVINIILKKKVTGTKVIAQTGTTTEGDGDNTSVSLNTSFSIGEKGFANLTTQYRVRDAVNRGSAYTGPVYSLDPEEDALLIQENNFFGQTGFDQNRVLLAGSAATENLSIVLNSEIPISDEGIFYLTGTRNSRISSASSFYALPFQRDRVRQEVYPNGFSPVINVNNLDNSLYAGFKKEYNGWALDFSHGIGANRVNTRVNNSTNPSLGSDSPRQFKAGSYSYTHQATNVDVQRDFDLFKNTSVSGGFELRRENLTTVEGDESSYSDGGKTFISSDELQLSSFIGTIGFIGLSSQDAISKSRTLSSIYFQANSELTDKLTLKAVGRTTINSDAHAERTYQWNLASRYNINDNFGFYASFANSNRLPSLHQLYFQNVSSQVISTGLSRIGTLNTESDFSRLLGIKLNPESSQYFSVGFNGRFSDNFSFSLNFYNISIYDRIALSGRISEGFEEEFSPLKIDIAQVFTNALDSNTSGFDASVRYQTTLGRGRINTSLTSNFTNTTIDDNIRIPEIIKERNAEEVFFSREEIARVISSQPKSKFILTCSYDINNFRFLLRNTYFGSVNFLFPLDANPEDFAFNEFEGTPTSRDQLFSAKLLTDLSVSYKLNKYFNFSAGGNNIFNVFPDKINHSALALQGNFVYSRRVQQFNVDGANFFLGLQLTF